MKNCLIIFILISSYVASCQNIFDSTHTAQYASYLYKTQQYHLAINEYERLLFFSPNNSDTKLFLVKSYRKNGEYDKAINRINTFSLHNNFVMDNIFSHEYMKLLLISEQNKLASNFLENKNAFTQIEITEYALAVLLLNEEYEKSRMFVNTNKIETDFYNSLALISEDTKHLKYKNPYLAMLLSAIVPGLGKFYTTDWKDGLISLFFVGANAFQAYRGFNQKGIESIYGWAFFGVSFGFYTGNIFGAFKSAKRYNKRINYEINKKVHNTVFYNF